MLQASAAQRTATLLPARILLYTAGLVIDVLGWGLAVFALRSLPVFAVQGIVAGQTAVAVALSRAVLHAPLRRRDLLGVAATGVGLTLLVAGATGRKGPLADLSEQERTLLELIGEGLTNQQISERMFLAEKTVKNYVSGC